MNNQQIIDWLLEGDVSIQYQVWRDLLNADKKNIQARITNEGWGMKILSKRKSDGHWGDRFYQPKWISTHYTLLDLRNLNLSSNNKTVKETIELVLQNNMADDGGIRLGPSTSQNSDVCVNGMFLNYASYFKTPEKNCIPLLTVFSMRLCRMEDLTAGQQEVEQYTAHCIPLFQFLKDSLNFRKRDLPIERRKFRMQ